jgi:hypothetical protein
MDNVIGVGMEDLSNKDWDELERVLQRKLEEVNYGVSSSESCNANSRRLIMAERRKKKLVCFQRTRSGVVKKGDTMRASIPVSSSFTLEKLVEMIDVPVVTPHVTLFPNYLHYKLNQASSVLVNLLIEI